MQFCTQNSKNLEEAFTSLSIEGKSTALSTKPNSANVATEIHPSDELSRILTALRKLREGLLATSNQAPSPVFSQRVHVFNIRLAILAHHPQSYQASLRYILFHLHTAANPLSLPELKEMTTYLILDTALREGNLVEAYRLRTRARRDFDFASRDIDDTLSAVVSNDWIRFWKVYKRVDGHIRALLHFHEDALRKSVLKAISRSYMKCDVKWIVKSATGGELSWDELVAREDVGWLRDGDVAIIRKPKLKT